MRADERKKVVNKEFHHRGTTCPSCKQPKGTPRAGFPLTYSRQELPVEHGLLPSALLPLKLYFISRLVLFLIF